MSRPPLPPFTAETAAQKARLAEDAWNTRDPVLVATAYTEDTRWRNRGEFLKGRSNIETFLAKKWKSELDYRLMKEVWAFHRNRIAVRFAYEWRNDRNMWFRSYGTENWEFDDDGLMRWRIASINDTPIEEIERKFYWPRLPSSGRSPSTQRSWTTRIPEMPAIAIFPGDVAFTPAVKATRKRKRSRHAYEHVEALGSSQITMTDELRPFIEEQQSLSSGTVNRDRQPRIERRSGPAFLKVLDEKPSASVDFVNKWQCTTLGSLSENPRACLFLIDYAHCQRIDIWGETRIVAGGGDLISKLIRQGYNARPEQVVLLRRQRVRCQMPSAHTSAFRGGGRRGFAVPARRVHLRT